MLLLISVSELQKSSKHQTSHVSARNVCLKFQNTLKYDSSWKPPFTMSAGLKPVPDWNHSILQQDNITVPSALNCLSHLSPQKSNNLRSCFFISCGAIDLPSKEESLYTLCFKRRVQLTWVNAVILNTIS